MNGPLSTYGGGTAGGSAEMGDAQTMAAVKNVGSLSSIRLPRARVESRTLREEGMVIEEPILDGQNLENWQF